MAVYKTPLFFTKAFVILNIQPTMGVSLLIILCESWATPQIMAKSNEGSIMTKVAHNDFKANLRAIPKNESWRLAIVKLHDLLVWLAID